MPNTEYQLRDALTELETALHMPIISGELKDWVEAVRQAFATVQQAGQDQLACGHREHFANILQEDLEMARQVEQLKQEDQAILEELTQFGRSLDGLAAMAAAVGRHESKADDRENRVIEAGQALIARMRKQETTITAWLIEAFQRDRGTVD
jgi:hypothetical protein